jgi:hypothetical protein
LNIHFIIILPYTDICAYISVTMKTYVKYHKQILGRKWGLILLSHQKH